MKPTGKPNRLVACCILLLAVNYVPLSAGDKKSHVPSSERAWKRTINPDAVKRWQEAARGELHENILAFWLRHAGDEQHGGFFGGMRNDGTALSESPKGLVLNTRLVWTFAAAYRLDPRPEYASTARRAYRYLVRNFRDEQHGGYFWLLDEHGRPLETTKEIYGQAFALYALAEYYRAFGDQTARQHAQDLFHLLETHAHDQDHLGYREAFKQDWSPAPNEKIGRGYTKSMNTHLHILEAMTNLYRVWPDKRVQLRLRELIEIFLEHIIDNNEQRFILFFDGDWTPREREVVSFGHDIEGSWLLPEAAEVLGDDTLIGKVNEVALAMAEAVYLHGLDEDGGLFYEAAEGRLLDDRKHWWAQAETVVGFLNAFQLSGDRRYWEAARRNWNFIRHYQVDHCQGEWFAVLSRMRIPDRKVNKISAWKAPYHNGRACMEIIRRLESFR